MDLLSSYIKIRKTINGSLNSPTSNRFDVAYGTDENYQLGAAISIASIMEHNKENNKLYVFHLFSNLFSECYISRMVKLAEQYQIKILLYEVNGDILKEFPVHAIWPISIYYRLLAFDYLSSYVDRLLYLDADVVCKNDLTFLETLPLSNYYAAVVPDIESTQAKTHMRIGIDFGGKYFNSGVILANLQAWKAEKLTEEVFSIIMDKHKYGNLKYPDQDALNIALLGHVYFLDNIYNTIFSLKSEFEYKDPNNYKKIITPKTIFIHYTGVTKPWHDYADYLSAKFFRTIYANTPFNDVLLTAAKSKSELKEKYKHCFYQKKYIMAISAWIKYKRM